jgi:succinate dehydrogenase hydrophobic anchor subunit
MHQLLDPARPAAPRARTSAARSGSRTRTRIAVTALGTALFAAAAAHPAVAATTTGSGQVLAAADIPTVISNVTNWIIGILAVLATLMFTIGGVRYVLAAGDPAEVAAAKTCFKSAAMGYCLAILAPVLVTVLKSLVGG